MRRAPVRSAAPLLALLAAAAACGAEPPGRAESAPPAPPSPYQLTDEGAGPVPAGSTRAAVVGAARLARDTVELGDEAIPESVAVLVVGRDTVRARYDSGRVYRLSVASARFRTADSLGVGTPLARLLRVPGVHAFTGEGAVYVRVPRHCGLSFRLAESGELGDGPDSVGAAELRRLPPATPVSEVRVLGCGGPASPAPSNQDDG